MNRKEIESKLIAKAWKDPAFKKRLEENSREVFLEEGVELIENEVFVLPSPPSGVEALSETELMKIAAASALMECAQESP